MPRHNLTAAEKRECREALLSDRHARRIRRSHDRASEAQGKSGEAGPKKKASKKNAMKLTTPAMARAKNRGDGPNNATAQPPSEAKDTVQDSPHADAKESEDGLQMLCEEEATGEETIWFRC